MRVRETETRIHWHEFIAAGLSQCEVDDRNLKLAFERLDHDHKDFVTFDDVMNLMGRDAVEKEEAMKIMWGDSMQACNIKNAQITYTDFLLLMKGQSKEEFSPLPCRTHGEDLDVLHEGISIESEESDVEDNLYGGSTYMPSSFGGGINGTNTKPQTQENNLLPSPVSSAAPSMGLVDEIEHLSDMSDGPLTMEDEDSDEAISKSADIAMKRRMSEAAKISTPPHSPVSLPFNTGSDHFTLQGRRMSPITPLALKRVRSKSYDDQDSNEAYQTTSVSRYSMSLPEHTHDQKDIDTLIKDETKTPLVVNRKLYRAHRQMRLAVFEASKRFEDQQMKRTKAELQAEFSLRFAPGLVMRRGHTKELSSGAIRTMMKKKQGEQQQMIGEAHRRGGRGKRARKKTNSDMSGMFSSVPVNEYSPTLPAIPASPIIVPKTVVPVSSSIAQDDPQLHLHNSSHREPTIPGVFRETSDPFRRMNTPLKDVFGSGLSISETIKEPQMLRQSNHDSGSHIKISVSDGELNQQIDPETPEPYRDDASETDSFIKTTPSWPPPPPLL